MVVQDVRSNCLESKFFDALQSLKCCKDIDLGDFVCKVLETDWRFFVEILIDLFVQYNFVGPAKSGFEFPEVWRFLTGNIDASKLLSIDTIPIYDLSIAPELLYVAFKILYSHDSRSKSPELKLSSLKLHLIKTWQAILDEPSMTLKSLLVEVLEELEVILPELSSSEKTIVYSTVSQLCLTFFMPEESKKFFELTLRTANVNPVFGGELGVNTKFQQEPLSQLFVKVEKLGGDFTSDFENNTCCEYPRNKALDDDTLLPETKFVNPDATKLPVLALEQQVALCLKLHNHITQFATDTSTEYERKALVNALVRLEPKFYPIQFYAMFQRSNLEGKHVRYLDRILMQMEELQNCYSLDCNTYHKNVAIFSLPFPAKWQTEKQYADILFELGCTATALDSYLKLKLWDVAAACYVRLDRKTEGTQLISQQLEANPSPKLWCLLGDLTSDISCYHKALKMTGNKFARAYRALGTFYCGEKRMELAIENFEKSLELNNLQPSVWYTLSCCAMTIKNWELARRSCQTFVKLESDHSHGWSNLGTIFLNLKETSKAHRAFSEAVRLNHENWQIWENFMYTSISLNYVNDSMRGFRRVSELKDKRIDVAALQKITAMTMRSKEEMERPDWLRRKTQFMEFMGAVTSKVSTVPEVWECYADVCYMCAESFADKEKGIRFYMKSLRQLISTPKVDSDFEVFWNCCQKTEKLLASFEDFLSDVNQVPDDVKSEMMGSLTNTKNFYKLDALFFENVTEDSETFISTMSKFVSELENKIKNSMH